MSRTNALLCAHSGLLFAALLGAGLFGFTGWLPPVSPTMSGDELVRMFAQHTIAIRVGVSLSAFGTAFFWTFAAAVAMQIRRIEGPVSHPLAYVQIASASGGVVAVLIPCYLWLAMAYRPEQNNPATLQLLNDFCWLSFISMYPPAMVQNLSMAFAIFSDKGREKVYPRWVGYFNIWITLGFIPLPLEPFFRSGAFTWAGVVGFWFEATIFFGWIIVIWWTTVQAIRQQAELENATGSSDRC